MKMTTDDVYLLEKVFNAVVGGAPERRVPLVLESLTTEELDMVSDQLCELQGKILIVRRTTACIEAYEGKRRRSE